jgi:hypothetical protein
MEGNSNQTHDRSDISNTNNDEKTFEGHRRDGQKVYPPKKIVLPAMAALYLAVFLVALVCPHVPVA